jgi:hypothetical protein
MLLAYDRGKTSWILANGSILFLYFVIRAKLILIIWFMCQCYWNIAFIQNITCMYVVAENVTEKYCFLCIISFLLSQRYHVPNIFEKYCFLCIISFLLSQRYHVPNIFTMFHCITV